MLERPRTVVAHAAHARLGRYVYAIVLAAALGGCGESRLRWAPPLEAPREHPARTATVESVRSVITRPAGSEQGLSAGATPGGKDTGVTDRPGLEVTVRLSNDELRAVVQDPAEEFKPGDRVKLVYEGDRARVTH